jgi:micrococcal nuclease
LLRYRLAVAALILATVSDGLLVLRLLAADPDPPVVSPRVSSTSPSVVASSPTPVEESSPLSSTDQVGDDGVPAEAERAQVTDHVDGDTLRLQGSPESRVLEPGAETTVRLLEIDTPESVDPSSPDQCFATRASRALERLLPLGSTAWVVPDRELLDPYGRTLLYLWTDSGVFVNLEMVERGLARAVLFEPNDAYIERMRRAEARARARSVGLWGACAYFGQPRGLIAPAETGAAPGQDPRFSTCGEANDSGFGDYVRGRDPEYDWYDDADGDGRVCET